VVASGQKKQQLSAKKQQLSAGQITSPPQKMSKHYVKLPPSTDHSLSQNRKHKSKEMGEEECNDMMRIVISLLQAGLCSSMLPRWCVGNSKR
jgi:hypothetical protein